MSKYLLFDWDPVEQPAALDPVERRTWCSLCLRVGDRIISRLWDKQLEVERTRLYVPAFPIARWLVQNWWALFHELCRKEGVPRSITEVNEFEWTRRHLLRCADSSVLLPNLYLFRDGDNLRAEWRADQIDHLPNMPGGFVDHGVESLEPGATEESFANFVAGTLDRLRGVTDPRVAALHEDWRAIQAADEDERRFCALAGKLGLDPYDPNELTEDVAAFLEGIQDDDTLARDFLDVAEPAGIVARWHQVATARQELGLRAISAASGPTLVERDPSAHGFGYDLARTVRTWLGVDPAAGPPNIQTLTNGLFQRGLRIEQRNDCLDKSIRALVGQSAGDIVFAETASVNPKGRRFLAARCLYHALTTAAEGPRLVTSAYSWQQRASRAFAAELLAPRQAIVARIPPSGADGEIVETLSSEFDVSTFVIANQLENAGIAWSSE